jgi:hypothetical protein
MPMRTGTGPETVATEALSTDIGPAATTTSRAALDVKCQLRLDADTATGGLGVPLASTVSALGAITVTSMLAASLTAISANVLAPGVRTQPEPETQASNGNPVPHQAVRPSDPSRSTKAGGSRSVKSRSETMDVPAGDERPSGSESMVPCVPVRPPAAAV